MIIYQSNLENDKKKCKLLLTMAFWSVDVLVIIFPQNGKIKILKSSLIGITTFTRLHFYHCFATQTPAL